MQFVIVSKEQPLDFVAVEHNGQSVQFATVDFKTANRSILFEELYGHINQFTLTLPPQVQDELFALYVSIDSTFQSVFNPTELYTELQRTVKKFYSHLKYDQFSNWVWFKSDIQYPASLLDVMPIEDINNEEKQKLTYLRKDYVELVILSLIYRYMIPVWGEFTARQRKESGSTYKESDAFGLIRDSWVATVKPLERLRIYVQCIANKHPDSDSGILNGTGTENLPDWLLALAVLRRLVCDKLSSTDQRDNIIAKIWTFLDKSTMRSLERRFDGMISDKKAPSGDDASDRTSNLEQYKIKQSFPDGDIVLLNVYTENMESMARKCDPTVDLDKVHECLRCIDELDFIVEPHHRTLAQWIIAPAIPPKAFDNLSYPSMKRVIACTQAVLWQWGMYDLATLATALPIDAELAMYGDIDKRINPTKLDQLVELYPFYYRVNKAITDTPEQIARKNNPAIVAIEGIVEELVQRQWETKAPMALQKLSSTQGRVKRFRVPANIRDLLTDLAIAVAARRRNLADNPVVLEFWIQRAREQFADLYREAAFYQANKKIP